MKIIFPDNHDMSRIYTQLNEDYDHFKMAIAYMLTMRGTPQLYYGTEVLMSNPGTDSHGIIRSDFPGGWPGDSVNVFEKRGLSSRQLDALNYLQKLLLWRKGNEVIHHGRLMHYLPANGTYVYFRYLEDQTVMVALNKNTQETSLQLDRFNDRIGSVRQARDVVTGNDVILRDVIQLPPKSVTILEF